MQTKDLHRLIKGHVAIKALIANDEAALKEKHAENKVRLGKIQAKLQEVIHKDNEEGLARVALPDGSFTAYARYEDKVKVKDRDELIAYITEGLSDEDAEMVSRKMDIFGNTVVKDVCTEYRRDTGAEETNGRLFGGELPPGIGLYTHKDVRITKGNK